MTRERGRAPRWLRWSAGAATIALLVAFARQVDWLRALAAIRGASPSLLIGAIAANLASLAVKGIRWGRLLAAGGPAETPGAVRATFAGAALNNVLIANGGDAVRVAAVARRSRRPSAHVLAALAVDRFTDLAVYGALFAIVAATFPLPAPLAQWRWGGIAIVGVALAITVAVARPASSTAGEPAHGSAPRAAGRVRRHVTQFLRSSREIASPRQLSFALLLGGIAWAGQWATYQLAAHAIHFPITPGDTLLALLVVNASFAIRLTPGNVGVFQLLYAVACSAVGLDTARAVAAAFLIQLIQYIPVTLVGLAVAPSLLGPTGVPRRG